RATGGSCPILSGSFGGGRGRLIFRGRFRSRFGAGRGAASACPGSGGASGAAFARFGRGGGAATPATRRRALVLLCLWLLPFCAGFGLVRRILVRRVVVGHSHALTFLRFIAAISSGSGFCAAWGCSGPA